MEIGKRIKFYREKLGLTQGDLATRAHISRISLGNYERGERIPPVDIFLRIAQALHVSTDELLEYDSQQDELTRCLNVCKEAGLFTDPFKVYNACVVGVYQNEETFRRARAQENLPIDIPVLTAPGFITAVNEGMANPNYKAAQKDLLKMYVYASILKEYAKEEGAKNTSIGKNADTLPPEIKAEIQKNQHVKKEVMDKVFDFINKNPNPTKKQQQELARQLHDQLQAYLNK